MLQRPVVALLVLLSAPAFAGCADGDGGEGDAAVDAVGTPDMATATGPSTVPPVPAASTRVTNVSIDGQTATAFCAGYDATGHCQIVQESASSWTEFSTLDLPGTPTRLQATFTWTPAAQQAPDLRVFVFSLAAEGPPVDGIEVTGDSPLAVDVDLTALEPGAGYAISLHSHTEVGAAGAMAIAEASQPFHAELSITTMG